MQVKAAKGLNVPKEDSPRTYFTHDEMGEPVEMTPYVLRRLADRELIQVDVLGGSA
jgi:hypothetical protein